MRTQEFSDTLTADDASGDEKEFVADCVIESDLELLLPATYVPQESERITVRVCLTVSATYPRRPPN